MRVIVLVKAADDSEKRISPSTDTLEAMGKLMRSWSMPASCCPGAATASSPSSYQPPLK